MSSINTTVARLDRYARGSGIKLYERGVNGREFQIRPNRVIKYRPGGRGIVRCEVYVDGQLDAVVHRTGPQMEELFDYLLVSQLGEEAKAS